MTEYGYEPIRGQPPRAEQDLTARKILLGNEAIALGLAESGCLMAASYPGTPASEVLSSLMRIKSEKGLKGLHLEWSINEKVAFECALANSFTGGRSAAIMKQVGLNVASDPLMSAAYTGVKGGFVIVAADDPGPHSSQTEQDSRFFAMMAKVPVLDPSSPAQARELIKEAFALSERHEIPVMLRPTTRVCHARQDLEIHPFSPVDRFPLFEKNPARWAATPKFRLTLHRELNEKIRAIAQEDQLYPRLVNDAFLVPKRNQPHGSKASRVCIVASGVAMAHAQEILIDLALWDSIPLYQVLMPFPLSPAFRDHILTSYERVLVLEESYPVIELQFQNREQVRGRTTSTVPSEGEMLPEGVEAIVRSFLGLPEPTPVEPSSFPGRRPTLCAGCPHRAAFFAVKKAFPKGIYPGDIGCYTLGLNLGVVDTVLCMGASVSLAAGFYHAYHAARKEAPTVCATIGDSTFFHAGIPALINAVVQGARFILVILDNSTTAMTGRQPTPATGRTMDGIEVPRISIPEIVRACGVHFIEEGDPYNFEPFVDSLRRAGEHTRHQDGGVAVVISKRPCLMDSKQVEGGTRVRVVVNDKCKGCDFCIKQFECPALEPHGEKEPIGIDASLCSGCGVCVYVCPHGALERAGTLVDR
jgi:indolepyruvate ferredoxin oxidoreductase, alpha subunit